MLVFALYVCTKNIDMPLPSFVLNDQTKRNSHGFFLLNSGGRFERFNENPVMLDNHDLDRLIGRWEHLRVEGELLKADPVFDDGTALGAERKGQVERGFLRGASPGILPLKAEYRHNPVTGDEDLYVTEWELFENSTTSVPSNAGAIALKVYTHDGQLVPDKDVRLHMDNIVKLCANSETQGKIPNIKNMEKITLTTEAYVALGINTDAATEVISAAIVKLHKAQEEANESLKTLQTKLQEDQKKRADALVKMGIDTGRFPATETKDYTELAMTNYALAEKMINAIPAKISLSGKANPIVASDIPAGRENWTYLRWLKEDSAGLAKIKTDNPEAFEAIKSARN